MHGQGFAPREAIIRRRQEAGRHAEAALQAAVDCIVADPGFNPGYLIVFG
jgi:hypothetical protein